MRTLMMVLVVLVYLSNSSGGLGCGIPKETFTKVVPANLENAEYIQQYIMVHWCLFPCEPNETKHLYVRVQRHIDSSKKIFEIDDHESCKFPSSDKSDNEGQDYMRNTYIRNTTAIPFPYNATPGITCTGGPYVFQQWLGNRIIHPWQKVERCIDDRECLPTNISVTVLRNHHVYGMVGISVQNHTVCNLLSHSP